MPIAASRIGCAASNARTILSSPRRSRTSSASPWICRATPPCSPSTILRQAQDEESQIQALERTRPSRPVTPGRPETQTHDDIRHGTTTLFAALDVLEGTVIGRCMQRHRHEDFLRVLNTIEAAVSAGKLIHVILDNHGTHKHPKVRAWLARHPRWIFHFTPTSASWMNAVEGFFSALTRRRLRRSSFSGVVGLQAAINRTIAEHNDRSKPLVRTKPAAAILDAVNGKAAPSECVGTLDPRLLAAPVAF